MTARTVSVLDERGRLIASSSIDAASDQEAVRLVLAGEGLADVDLDADTWYRVKCGETVASAAGDEFLDTAEGTRSMEARARDLGRLGCSISPEDLLCVLNELKPVRGGPLLADDEALAERIAEIRRAYGAEEIGVPRGLGWPRGGVDLAVPGSEAVLPLTRDAEGRLGVAGLPTTPVVEDDEPERLSSEEWDAEQAERDRWAERGE